jgi:hypothetical protein
VIANLFFGLTLLQSNIWVWQRKKTYRPQTYSRSFYCHLIGTKTFSMAKKGNGQRLGKSWHWKVCTEYIHESILMCKLSTELIRTKLQFLLFGKTGARCEHLPKRFIKLFLFFYVFVFLFLLSAYVQTYVLNFKLTTYVIRLLCLITFMLFNWNYYLKVCNINI